MIVIFAFVAAIDSRDFACFPLWHSTIVFKGNGNCRSTTPTSN